MLTFTFDYI